MLEYTLHPKTNKVLTVKFPNDTFIRGYGHKLFTKKLQHEDEGEEGEADLACKCDDDIPVGAIEDAVIRGR